MPNNLKTLIVIPARYNSSRFPGKPLMKINGTPMIQRTYNQALKNKYTTNIIVATDSEKIKSFCTDNKIPVIITSSCETGTDRVAEVSKLMPEFDGPNRYQKWVSYLIVLLPTQFHKLRQQGHQGH